MKNKLFLEQMCSPDIASAIAEGTVTVIIPCGAVEQHGPHLPLFTDAEHGTHLGVEVAQRLGNALVAPTIRVGCSEHHMAFAGTISIREKTFRAVCKDYCKSLSHHGFTKICILPTHGGNFKPLENMLEELNSTAGDGCTVVAFTDLISLVEIWREAVEDTSGLGNHVGGHADIAESSLMLYLHAELVKEHDAQKGFTSELDETAIQKIINDGLHTVTPNGILGDARGMSKKIGRDCLATLADFVADYFRER